MSSEVLGGREGRSKKSNQLKEGKGKNGGRWVGWAALAYGVKLAASGGGEKGKKIPSRRKEKEINAWTSCLAPGASLLPFLLFEEEEGNSIEGEGGKRGSHSAGVNISFSTFFLRGPPTGGGGGGGGSFMKKKEKEGRKSSKRRSLPV